MTKTATTRRAARGLANNDAFRLLVRAGYVANGILHVLIGILALQVAFGGNASADQGGAFGAVADAPGGVVLLWAIVVGTVALGLFQVVQLVGASEWTDRAKFAGKAVAYIAIGVIAATVALGGSTGGGEQSVSATLLQLPIGVILLLVVALGVASIGGYLVVKGARQKFLDDLERPTGTTLTVTKVSGTAGYIAKGVALVIVGGFLAFAAIAHDPAKAEGLDGALTSLTELPFGQVLLTVVALGLVLFGVYCFVRARFARL